MSLTDHFRQDTLNEAFSDPDTFDLFESWYVEYLRGDYKETTIQGNLSNAKNWLQYCEENDIPVDAASETEIIRYLRRVQGRLSDSALSNTMTAIRKWQDWLVEIDYRASDPTEEIVLPDLFNSYNPETSQRQRALNDRTAPDELTVISPEEVDSMAQYCGSPRARNELLIRLMFQSTMRPAEVSSARIDNIDWDDRSIHIKTAKADPDHEFYRRFVYWHRDLDALMHRWCGDGGEREAYSTHSDSPYVFLTRKKPYIRSSYVSRIVREAAQRAGIQKELGETARQVEQYKDDDSKPDGTPLYQVSGHELRRASITHYVNNVDELNIHEVQALAGHENIQQTIDYVAEDWDEIQSKMRRITF